MTRPAFAGAVLDPALPSRRSAHISTFPADHTQSDQTFNSARQGAQPWRLGPNGASASPIRGGEKNHRPRRQRMRAGERRACWLCCSQAPKEHDGRLTGALCPQGRNVSSPFCDNKGGILFFKKPHGFFKTADHRVPVVAQWLTNPLGTMRWWVRSLASLSGLRIRHCCDCGVGWQLQLR